ncbi:MAG: RNA polymerase sigma-70 factor [Dysgonamonadaceae bacterium]|jgi:RNA polymerase sigma-70 factor (ECF subfamily)|nr:RNA polymerase sigma-70 factor [Dysgonamonadaceae bacterium]
MHSNVTIETLEGLKRGEHRAFEAVFLCYFDKVKRFIAGLIRSEDDAEDLAQDVFAKLWTNRETIDTGFSFGAFLFTMSRNTAFNYLKHKLVHVNYMNEYTQREETDTPEELVFAKETELLIEMTLSRMPEKRSEIYRLSRLKGLSNGEIAALLNISQKTVENNLSMAIGEIRKEINNNLN